MRISITRTGGFAGTSESVADLDTSRLTGDVAAEVHRQLLSMGFFDLPAEIPESVTGADFFRYEIAVVDGARTHRVAFTDAGGPQQASLRELISFVKAAATKTS